MTNTIKHEKKVEDFFAENSKIELTDEQLDKISGGRMDFASNNARTDDWDADFAAGKRVYWLANGIYQEAIVMSYSYDGDRAISFNLNCVNNNLFVNDIPANQILMEFPD